MSTLTQRAEQALIGAFLSQPWQFVVFEETAPADFVDLRLARVYKAMIGTWGSVAPDDITGNPDEIAARANVPGPYLEHLKSACPVPFHAGAYSELVAEASARRAIRSAAAGLEARAKTAGYGTLSGHSLLAAAALKKHSARFDPDTMTAALTGPAAGTGTRREQAEESVLAALLNRHPRTLPVLEILEPGAWSDPARAEIHAAIITLAAADRDIDPLTVDWEIASARERNVQPVGRAPAESAGPSYATKLAGIPVTMDPAKTANALVTEASKEARSRAGDTPEAPQQDPAAGPDQVRRQPALLEIPPQAPGDGHAPRQRM